VDVVVRLGLHGDLETSPGPKALNTLLVTEQRLDFAAQAIIACTGVLQKHHAMALFVVESLLKKLFDSMPPFRRHRVSPLVVTLCVQSGLF
jgi:hypothetical protein